MRQHDLPHTPNWRRLSPTYRKHIERRINTHHLLESQIEICRFRVRIERALLQIERNRRMAEHKSPKNPKLRGLIQGMDQFNHAVDSDIEKAASLLETAHARRQEVFSNVHTKVGEKVSDLTDFLSGLDDLEAAIGDNGAPLDGDSQGSPEASANSAEAPHNT